MKLDLQAGREFCMDQFNVEDPSMFTVDFLIKEDLGDAWVSPEGEVFPFKSYCRHSTFRIEIGAFGPLRNSLEELGWLRLSGGDCYFEFHPGFQGEQRFLSNRQKEVLIALIDAHRFEERYRDCTSSPKGLLKEDEEQRGRL